MINMVKLSEVSDLTVGYVGPMGKEYVENGTLFLRSLNIKPFSFDLTDVKYITEDFNETISKSILHYNDVVIVRTGIPGIAAVVPKEFDGCNCSDLVIVHPDTSKINPYYLCAFINSWGRLQVKNAKVGAIQKHFNVTEAKEMLIPLPDMEEQNLIANILRDINGKINLNNKIHSKLDSLLHSIYDYWFLQFEFPNEEGKPYKSSGGKMVWNEELKREIPDGWKISKIGDICEITRGVSYTAANLKSDGTPILSLASISRKGQYIPEGIKYYSGKYNESKVLKPYDAIMCNTDMTQEKEIVAKVILVPDIFGKSQILSTHHISHLVFDDEIYKEYVYLTTQTKWFHNHIKGFSAGTNVLGLDSDGFKDFKLLIPTNDVLIKFNKIVMDNEMYKSNLINENQELASLRDFLLPMLMNGQVTFKEANE